MTGTVKWFNGKKGYGFIQDIDGNDLFFHFSALQMDGYKTIDQGVEVEYEVGEGEKGPQAISVKAVS